MSVNDPDSRRRNSGAIALGSALVVAGAILLMDNFGIIWVRLSDLWPVALIAIGLEGLLNARRGVNS